MIHRQKLIETKERLAATRQCSVCLAGVATLNGFAAILLACDAMTFLWGCVWTIGSLAFSSAAVIFALLPEIKARKLERDMWREDNGSYLQPHQ